MAVKLNAQIEKDHLHVPVQVVFSLVGMAEHVKVHTAVIHAVDNSLTMLLVDFFA